MEPVIYDRIHLGIPNDDKGLKDSLLASFKEVKDSQKVPALEIVLDATHGGYVNRNYAFYKSEGQEKSAKSFYTPFPKPILREHDDEKDPIGRIVGAEFVRLSQSDTTTDPASKIRLKGLVTDSEAIQKILDGRYMTVSISGRPKTSPICSICNEKAGAFGCENDHMRGQTYDGKQCYYIIDELDFSEVSFVNKPADQSGKHAAGIVAMKVVEAPALDAEAQKMFTEAIAEIKGRKEVAVADAVAATPEKKVECSVCKVAVDSGTNLRCPTCKHVVDADGKIIDSWEAMDKGMDNYVANPAQEGGHAHRVRLDPATGNGFTDYVLGHSHDVVGKLVQNGLTVANGVAAETPHTHPLGKKIAAIDSTESTECASCKELKVALAAEKTATKTAQDSVAAQVTELNGKVTASQTTLDKLTADLAKAEDAHKKDLIQVAELTKSYRDQKVKNVLALSLILGKDSILNTFSGKNAEERAASYEKKLQEFKDISIEELTRREEALITELSKQAIVRLDLMGPADPKLDKTIKEHQSKKQRMSSWWTGQ